MKKIVGLSVDIGSVFTISDQAKYLMALSDSTAVIYDSVADFFTALNNDRVDTENLYWFEVEVEVGKELIGYQVIGVDTAEIDCPHESFIVFDTEELANEFIDKLPIFLDMNDEERATFKPREEYMAIPIYEGDVEEPTIISNLNGYLCND
jgi:hypothetical protein